jgi:hypothetical protein
VILKLSLPSVGKKTLGKELFAECCIFDTRQRNSLPSVKNKTLGKELLRRVFSFTEGFCVALGKELLCRVPEKKHSAKYLALGKEPNSGSDRQRLLCQVLFIRHSTYTLTSVNRYSTKKSCHHDDW